MKLHSELKEMYAFSSYNARKTKTFWIDLTHWDNYKEHFWNSFIGTILQINVELYVKLRSLNLTENPEDIKVIVDTITAYISGERPQKSPSEETTAAQAQEPLVLVFSNLQTITDHGVIAFIVALARAGDENLSVIAFYSPKGNRISAELISPPPGNFTVSSEKRLPEKEIAPYFSGRDIHLSRLHQQEIHALTGGSEKAVLFLADHFDLGYEPSFNALQLEHYIIGLFDTKYFEQLTIQDQKILICLSRLKGFSHLFVKDILAPSRSGIVTLLDCAPMLLKDKDGNYTCAAALYKLAAQKTILLAEDEITDFYLKTAAWHQQQGDYAAAVHYYKNAGAYDALVQMMLKDDRLPRIQLQPLLSEILECLPKRYTQIHPEVLLLHSYSLVLASEYEKAESAVIKHLPDFVEDSPELEGEAHALLGLIHLLKYELNFPADYETAAGLIKGVSRFKKLHYLILKEKPLITCATNGQERFLTIANALYEMEDMMNTLIAGYGPFISGVTVMEYNFYTGRLDQARQLGEEILEMDADAWIKCRVFFLMMRIAMAKGSIHEIDGYLLVLQEAAAADTATESADLSKLATAWYQLWADTSKTVHDYFHLDTVHIKEIEISGHMESWDLIGAFYLLEKYDFPHIIPFLDDRIRSARKMIDRIREITFLIIKAVALQISGKKDMSIRTFELAYTLAKPSNIILPFIEMGYAISPLIADYAMVTSGAIPFSWIGMIQERAEAYGGYLHNFRCDHNKSYHLETASGNTLSAADLSILNLLRQGYTNVEIAEIQSISLNTLKRSIKRLYQKLGVLNRGEAIQTASAMHRETTGKNLLLDSEDVPDFS